MYYYMIEGSFSFDALLTENKSVYLELIEDADMLKMTSSNILRSVITTNTFQQVKTYIFYLIKLYRNIMLDFPFSVDGYKWVQELSTSDLQKDDAYILEVDLHDIQYNSHLIPLYSDFIYCRLRVIQQDKTKSLKLVLSMGIVLKKYIV